MPYIPHTDDDIALMLEKIGIESVEELFSAIPQKIRQQHEPAVPEALSEQELIRTVEKLARSNMDCSRLRCFLGGGTYHHYIPPAVPHILSRSEFYSSYTPYQAEFSQGTLQSIFEFQTMVCELFGMDVANASMYDGAQAAAEAAKAKMRMKLAMRLCCRHHATSQRILATSPVNHHASNGQPVQRSTPIPRQTTASTTTRGW